MFLRIYWINYSFFHSELLYMNLNLYNTGGVYLCPYCKHHSRGYGIISNQLQYFAQRCRKTKRLRKKYAVKIRNRINCFGFYWSCVFYVWKYSYGLVWQSFLSTYVNVFKTTLLLLWLLEIFWRQSYWPQNIVHISMAFMEINFKVLKCRKRSKSSLSQ